MEPIRGMAGMNPRLRASSSAGEIPALAPAAPLNMVLSRTAITARTCSAVNSGPTACARPRTVRYENSAASSGVSI